MPRLRTQARHGGIVEFRARGDDESVVGKRLACRTDFTRLRIEFLDLSMNKTDSPALRHSVVHADGSKTLGA